MVDDARHERRRAAEEHAGRRRVVGDLGEVSGVEEPVEVTGAGLVGEAEQQPAAGERRDETVELVGVAEVRLGAGVVDERDRAVVLVVDERAQHRQHRRDAAPAAEQDEVLGACSRGWEHEVAARLGEAEDVADGCVLDEVAADPTGRDWP